MALTLKVDFECLRCCVCSDVNGRHISTFIRLTNGRYINYQVTVLGSNLLIPFNGIIIIVLLYVHHM